MRGIYALLAHVRPLLALASDKVEREDGHLHTVKPQVTFASLSPPAVMDIRRLLALASDKVERGDTCLRLRFRIVPIVSIVVKKT